MQKRDVGCWCKCEKKKENDIEKKLKLIWGPKKCTGYVEVLGPKSKFTRNCCLCVLYHVTTVISTWMIDHMLRSHSTNFNFNF